MLLTEGVTFNGKYRLESILGQGASKIAWKAFDTLQERHIALKIFRPGSSEQIDRYPPDFNHRARQEAKILTAVGYHPHIAQIYDARVDEETQIFFISEEYVEGETLEKYLPATGQPILNQRIRFKSQGAKIANGLSLLAKKNIVHGDLTMRNIIMCNDAPKIVDFGQSIMMNDEPTTSSLLYQSPEHVLKQPLTHKSDIWQLGVILYRAVTGVYPFMIDAKQYKAAEGIERDKLRAELKKFIVEKDPIPSNKFDHYAHYLNEAIRGCLQKDPSKRIFATHVEGILSQ